jgi:uncharacterized membrane protein (DUF106 family)
LYISNVVVVLVVAVGFGVGGVDFDVVVVVVAVVVGFVVVIVVDAAVYHATNTHVKASLKPNKAGRKSEPTPHGDQRLHVQQQEAPDDGHSGVRNMSSSV